MGIALLVVVGLGSIQFLEDGASDEFGDRADRAGAPDLSEGGSDGGTTGGTTTGGGTDGPSPVTQVATFGGFSNPKTSGKDPWTANLGVNVDDADGKALEGVTVTGTWTFTSPSGAVTTVPATCNQTNNQGRCQFQLTDIPIAITTVTFTMTNISGGVPPVVYNGGTHTLDVTK